MKKIAIFSMLTVFLFGCTNDNEVIKQSLNNIKDEMVNMQSEMAEMKITVEEVNSKTQANTENINANSNALAEIRSETNYLSNEIALMKEAAKEREAMMEKQESETMDMGEQNAEDEIIIIEDNFTDKSSLYSYAYELYKNGQYAESTAKFNEFLAKYPSDELSDNAVYWLGEIQYALKDYEAAISNFQRLASEYPQGNKVPDGLVKMGYSYGNIGQMDKARETMKRVVNQYPGTRAYNLARKKLEAWGVSVE
ncbi:tol-pal system protein YbgF [Limisalsivibrio acetivorans]|uniref:tol-pal system protein YbgF n=1 Tax=Limisalsivibrio acetivorans TaxID=1304888 RepID=UPI0003B52641|nr:tol-pal system protein YbgF [Limisalsivibrio acetivorans]